jgi:glycine/D-amino acid oxidase-like deaminating enzyme
MLYDFFIIGGGIAGSCSAYFLKKHGFKVRVFEKNKICSSDSYAAGAFLSPKMSKPSAYKDYLNSAFLFSIDFYKKNFPHLLHQGGLLKLPLNQKDQLRCRSYEPYMQVKWSYDDKKRAYLFPEAGLIDPITLCHALLKNIDINENYEVSDIKYDTLFHIDKFQAKNLLIATGSSKTLIDEAYLETKKIGGYRYDVSFDGYEKQQTNIHKDLSISLYHKNQVAIGATHIKNTTTSALKKDADIDRYDLLKRASKIIPLNNLKVKKTYTGFRSATNDLFPIIGKIIDSKKTLKKFPTIKKGTKIPCEKYTYYPHIFIHTALASRGFVTAPYNAKILIDLIINNTSIDTKLSTSRLFLKKSRNICI